MSVRACRSLSRLLPPPPRSPLFPYTTLFRSPATHRGGLCACYWTGCRRLGPPTALVSLFRGTGAARRALCSRNFPLRSEEHTSELQSRVDLVCRLPLGKKKQLLHRANTVAHV